nr:unnamed protein product [Callosobruchus analis]
MLPLLKLLDSIQNRAVRLIDTPNLTKYLHSLERRRRATTLTKKSLAGLPTVEMEGRPLVESPSIKLLGISINNNMSWHDHVATIAKTASQKLGVLFRCRKLYTPEQLLLLYKAQIRPSLEYCSHVWGCAPKHSLKLLDSIQNRAVKLIDTDNLTKDLHSLDHRRRVAGLTLFYRFYHGRCSSELSQIITPKAVRTRNTRDALHAHPYQVEVPTPRTSLLQHSFFWKTSTLWNELPGSLFPDGYNLQRFKTNFGERGSGYRVKSGEPQDFYKLRDQCLDRGELFEDPEFPATDSSLFFSRRPDRYYEWRRPNEIANDPQFFVEGFSRFDVQQGELGDCWLLAAAANLTLYKRLFFQIVPDDQDFDEKYAGIFHFR